MFQILSAKLFSALSEARIFKECSFCQVPFGKRIFQSFQYKKTRRSEEQRVWILRFRNYF